jgi:hypothetical protein
VAYHRRHDTWHTTGGVRAEYDRRDWPLWRRRWTTACSNVDEMIDYANSLRNAKHPSEKRLYLLLAAKVPDLQVRESPVPICALCTPMVQRAVRGAAARAGSAGSGRRYGGPICVCRGGMTRSTGSS